MFGANSPKLMAMIAAELQKEKEAIAGQLTRTGKEILEPTEEEIRRTRILQAAEEEERAEEDAKKRQIKLEHRTVQAKAILEMFGNTGVILVLPRAFDSYEDAFTKESLSNYNLTIHRKDKVNLIIQKTKPSTVFFSKLLRRL